MGIGKFLGGKTMMFNLRSSLLHNYLNPQITGSVKLDAVIRENLEIFGYIKN